MIFRDDDYDNGMLFLRFIPFLNLFLLLLCVDFLFNDCCVATKTISGSLLLYPGLGLALSENEQWRSSSCSSFSFSLSSFVFSATSSSLPPTLPRLLAVSVSVFMSVC